MYVILILLWMLIFGPRKDSRNIKRALWLSFIPAIFVMGTRDVSVGLDTAQYMIHFEDYKMCSISEIFQSKDFLFWLFMKFCSFFSGSYYFYQVVYSILYCGLYNYFIRHNCKDCFLASFVFISIGLFSYALNLQRQMFSVAFCVLAWTLIVERNNVKGFITYCLACCIHMTSIIFFPVILLSMFRISQKVLKLLPIALLIILSSMTLLVTKYGGMLVIYDKYLDNFMTVHKGGVVEILWGLEVTLSLFIIYLAKNKKQIDDIAAICTLAYVGFNFLGYSFNYIERLGLAFFPFTLVVFDAVGRNIENKSFRIAYRVCALICFSVYAFLSLTTEETNYKPFF